MLDTAILGEKASLKRFLLTYIVSTIFLLGSGMYFYYKFSYQQILHNAIDTMKNNINLFIHTNRQKTAFLHNNTKPVYLDFPIAVYVNHHFKAGNFTPKNIDLFQSIIQDGTTIYYIHNEHKIWGDIYFVTYKNIKDDIARLQKELILFFLFSLLFISIISYILGKIFLNPMKKSITLLENFITDATHEINTPISNILINIELAKELYPALANTQECKRIENAAFRISKLFKDLSFIQLGYKEQKHIQTVAVDEVLQERIAFFETFIKNKNLLLHQNIKPLTIAIDLEDLIRLIDNLLSNAIKYAPPNSHIHIELSQCLTIINSGTIANTKDAVKKFVRQNKNEGGFGLGLYIVDKICRHYNFEFSLQTSNSKVYAKVCFNTAVTSS